MLSHLSGCYCKKRKANNKLKFPKKKNVTQYVSKDSIVDFLNKQK